MGSKRSKGILWDPVNNKIPKWSHTPKSPEISPPLFSQKDGGFTIFHPRVTPIRGQVPHDPALRPFIKSELPPASTRGQGFWLQQLSSGTEARACLRVGLRGRLRVLHCLALPRPLLESRSRRQRLSGHPRELIWPQRGRSNWRVCASRGPRIIPGLLGRRAVEGSQPPGAQLASERPPTPAGLSLGWTHAPALAWSRAPPRPSFPDLAAPRERLWSARAPRRSPDHNPKLSKE